MSNTGWRQWFQHTCRRLRDAARKRARRFHPGMEPLEDRAVPAIYNVTTLDDGPGTVTPLGGDVFDVTTLRQAITEANTNVGADTINLPVGDIKLDVDGIDEDGNASGDLDIIDGDLTIVGQGAGISLVGTDFLEIDDRVFHVQTADRGQVTFRGFTIHEGHVRFFDEEDIGGGILNQGSLRLENMVVEDNVAEGLSDYGGAAAQGGGIYNYELSRLEILDSSILDNHATGQGETDDSDGEGGGIYNDCGATLSISGSTLTGNIAEGGDGGSDNDGQGGAIHNCLDAITDIVLSRIVGNTATGGTSGPEDEDGDGEGGGIYNDEGTVSILTTTLDGNQAIGGLSNNEGSGESFGGGDGQGGGVYNGFGTVSIDRSTFSNNRALGNINSNENGGAGRGEGGGYWATDGTTSIINSTFSGNEALGASTTDQGTPGRGVGGGLYFGGGEGTTAALINVTVTQNDATNGAGGPITQQVASDNGGGIFAGEADFIQLFNTIVAQNTGADGTEPDDVVGPYNSAGNNLIGTGDGSTGLVNGVNNDQVGTDTSPVDPGLNPLADNGGPTFTHALLATSNARNSGNNTGAPATDQRGVSRPQELIVDIGAFEFQVEPPPPPPVNVNADVAVTKTITLGRRIRRGRRRQRNATFTIAVNNTGPGVATNVKLEDVIPARFLVVSINTSQGTFGVGDGKLVVDIGTLQSGGIATITVVGRIKRAGVLTNTAVVPLAAYDPNAANNTATAQTVDGIPLFFSDPLDRLLSRRPRRRG